MSSLLPLKAKADVRDATPRARTLVSALMISSAMPSVKYSLSASALMLVKGRTAIDWRSESAADAPLVPAAFDSAFANSDTLANRPAGSREGALSTASDNAGGTFGNGAARSLNLFAITPCAVLAVNGGVPAIISYTTQARLY